MPIDFVEARHGQSEANVFQQLRKADPDAPLPAGFLERHDSQMRLSPLGREQADATGEWLRREFPRGFDRQYVSTHVRAIETAGRLRSVASGMLTQDGLNVTGENTGRLLVQNNRSCTLRLHDSKH